mgnify:CR=1 FL=1
MKIATLVSAALFAAAAGQALAGAAPATTVSCADSFTTVQAGYLSCQGPLPGNIAPGPNQVSSVTFAGYGSFELVGTTDDGSGTFLSNPGSVTSGTLELATVQHGLFVIGLKGGPDYSMYLFDGGQVAGGISSIDFDTYGLVTGGPGGHAGPDLSHAAFLAPVPEPATAALLAGGLAVVGWLGRRRGSL